MNKPLRDSGISDDQKIWKRFVAGDVEAYEHLMLSNFRILFHYGSKFSKDKEFVKDSIQDLFLILWEKRLNLSVDIVVRPYLMASLRRLMHRNYRNSAKWEGEDIDNSLFEIEFSVEQQYIEEETSLVLVQKMKVLLDDLPPRQKEVVYLRFFQELDRSQIAEIMEITPQTVSNLLQIAIKQLKNHWRMMLLLAFQLYFPI